MTTPYVGCRGASPGLDLRTRPRTSRGPPEQVQEDDERIASKRRGGARVKAIEAAAPRHVDTVRRSFVDRLTPEQLDDMAAAAETILDVLEAEEPDGDGQKITAITSAHISPGSQATPWRRPQSHRLVMSRWRRRRPSGWAMGSTAWGKSMMKRRPSHTSML